MRRRKRTARRVSGGFTLVELLVATAVFSLLLVALTEVLSSAQVMVRQGTARTDADKEVRTVSTLIERDLRRKYIGSQVPIAGSVDEGDDWFGIMTLTPGYEGDRNVSWVEYRIRGGRLQRGSRGYRFGGAEDREPSDDLIHIGMGVPTLADDEFQSVSDRVLRFEIDVMDWTSSSADSDFLDTGVSVLLYLAVVGDDALALLDEAGFEALRALIPNAGIGASPIPAWREAIEGAIENGGDGIPLPALQSVRFYQTVVSLRG